MIANSLTIEGGGWEIIEKSTQYWKCLGGGYLIEGNNLLDLKCLCIEYNNWWTWGKG